MISRSKQTGRRFAVLTKEDGQSLIFMLRAKAEFLQPFRPSFRLVVIAAFQMLGFPTSQLNVCMAFVNILLDFTAKSLSNRDKLLRLGFVFEVFDDPVLPLELQNLDTFVGMFVIVAFLSAVCMQVVESGLD